MLQHAERDQVASTAANGEPEPLQLLDKDGNLLADEPPLTDDEVLAGLRAILLGRRFDELCIKLQRRGLMVTFAPGIGQEACTVGGVMAMDSSRDWFVPQYREVAGQFLHGLSLKQAFLWHMGSPLGFHIPEGLKMLPFQAGVAGHVSHAVGLGWGLKLQGKTDVVIAHFGEGATSQGDFYEPMNLAGVVKAPVILFCQNNNWAISTPRNLQSAAQTLAQKAVAAGIPGILIDGNDLFAVYEITRQAIDRARQGEGPTLIEGYTYRLGIHTTADDSSRYEPAELREQWRDRDPVLRLQRYLEGRGRWDASVAEEMENEIKAQMDAAWEEAQAEPLSSLEESLTHVFAEMTPRLREQREVLVGGSDDA
jgi:pyruvate dehydrogenase E1 component alpha subunit